MFGQGRGRGEAQKTMPEKKPMKSSTGSSNSSDNGGSGDGERIIRGRGGFRPSDTITCPVNITVTKAQPSQADTPMEVVSNFVGISTMPQRDVYQYRVDYEPNVESLSARRKLFYEATRTLFDKKVIFDGMSDARSGICSPETMTEYKLNHPNNLNEGIKVKVKRVGIVTGSFEMTRVYNMHMKDFFRALGFYQVSTNGAYVHPQLYTPVGRDGALFTVRGFRSGANLHKGDKILMNLETCHKLMQRKNVLQNLQDLKNQNNRPSDLQAHVRAQLVGKLVVACYNKIVYRVEDVNFDMTPQRTFMDRKENREISFIEYYKKRYNVEIKVTTQPLLLVVQNNKRKGGKDDGEKKDCYVVPELCNIAGLTEQQRNDNMLRVDLIKSSQIDPTVRVQHMEQFLKQLHDNIQVRDILNNWGYQYDQQPLSIRARTLKKEMIGVGKRATLPTDKWAPVDHMASFERDIMKESVAVPPQFAKMVVIISRTDFNNQDNIFGRLKAGFGKVGLTPQNIHTVRIHDGDQAHMYAHQLRELRSDTTAALIILPRQNKERYDAIKKLATTERGIITQVVTSKLMCDDRKASGAAIKIGVQVAAKLGGEPWYVAIPLPNTMICGYDTYHDTSNRGRSYGAFVASMNPKFSRWHSRADHHDKIDELSSHMAQNLSAALTRYYELNKVYPDRLFIYRDGVGDGQIDHVFNIELKQIKAAAKQKNPNIKITFVIVNKSIGARFYWKTNGQFKNPPPGSVIDDVVTRKGRYDFYLISQSTRNGTVTPTYYNIIEDESGLDAAKQQTLAFKLCFLYYNWTGTVRVPAPCQYAHKLAMLCGENLHGIPNVNLNDKLHYL